MIFRTAKLLNNLSFELDRINTKLNRLQTSVNCLSGIHAYTRNPIVGGNPYIVCERCANIQGQQQTIYKLHQEIEARANAE